MISTYYRAFNSASRSNKIVPYLSGKYLICGYSGAHKNEILIGNPATGITSYILNGANPEDLIIDVAVGTDGNGWLLKAKQELIEITGQPPVVSASYTRASTVPFISMCCVAAQPYVLDTSGTISTYSGSGFAAVTTSGTAGFTGSLKHMVAVGSTIYVADVNGMVNQLTFSATTTASWGTAFSTVADCDLITYDGAEINAFGRAPVVLDTGTDASSAIASTQDQFLVLSNAAGKVYTFTQTPASTGFPFTSASFALTSAVAPSDLAINNNQALVTDSTNGQVEIIQSASGTWSSSGTSLAVAGAANISLITGGINNQALVSSTSGNLVHVLEESGATWSEISSFSVTSPTVSAVYDTLHAAVADSTGVSLLSYSTNWSVAGHVTTPTAPSEIFYFGTNGATLGAIYDSSGTRYIAAIDVSTQTIVDTVAIGPTANFNHLPFSKEFVFDATKNKIVKLSVIWDAGTGYSKAVSDSYGRYFLLNSNSKFEIFKRANPGNYINVKSATYFRQGGTLQDVSGSYGEFITCATEGAASGDLYAFTSGNRRLTYSAGSMTIAEDVPPDTNQPATVPIGVSSVTYDSSIKAASSIYGGLIEIT